MSPTHRARRGPPPRRRGGFTLIELITAITVLVFGIGALVTIVATTSAANRLNYETALALSGAQGVVERMRGEEFDEIFARYDADPDDDPDGKATAPGRNFAIAGLSARPDDPDGLPGEILLPADGPGLFEDENLPIFGMPRDLNLDGLVDGFDHSADYRILPVIVRIRWQGRTGPRQIQFTTSIGDL